MERWLTRREWKTKRKIGKKEGIVSFKKGRETFESLMPFGERVSEPSESVFEFRHWFEQKM
jgi:hypothetical protein